MSGRRVRVEQALRDTLAEMIDRDVKDPRVKGAGLVTVQRVELNADLSVARVYVSVFGDDITAKKAMAGLAAAGTFLRGPLGRKLHLQRPPELRFVRDESPEIVRHLAEIVRDDQARARAAGRDDAAPAAAPALAVVAPVETPSAADDDSEDRE
jgi:ribosome-binding factor A